MGPNLRSTARTTVDPSLWGKLGGPGYAPYPLIQHSLDTAAAATAVWDRWLRSGLRDLLTAALSPGDPGKARAMYAALAGVHDVGKINAVFQGQFGSEDTEWFRDDFIPGHLADLGARGYDISQPRCGSGLGPLDLDPRNGELSGAAAAARRHEAVTLYVVAGVWPGKLTTVADNWAAAVLGAHHGRYHPHDLGLDRDQVKAGFGIDRILGQLTGGRWGEQQQAHIGAVLEATGVTIADLRSPLNAHHTEAVILLSGLVSIADWIASTSSTLAAGRRHRIDAASDPVGWFNARAVRMPGILQDTLGVYNRIDDAVADVMGEHVEHLSDLQKQALNVGRGLWVAAVPAGDGKTEAALLRHSTDPDEGMLFALPTRATTDAMWDRIQKTYRNTPNYAAILHGNAMLNSFYAARGEEARIDTDGCGGHEHDGPGLTPNDWLSGPATALLAPLSVSTCDQVLLGALAQRRSFMRLTAIANRHVILDEVHTYDTYQSTLLEEMLHWCGRTDTRVTLLSASLPEFRLKRYAGAYAGAEPAEAIYPGVTAVHEGAATQSAVSSRREYDLNFRIHEVRGQALVAEHVRLAAAAHRKNPNAKIAVVVNQVDRAIQIGKELARQVDDVVVFHSRMTAGHRMEISEQVLEAAGKDAGDGGIVVVGTQVIEASLDVDFDVMITDLAPAPSLIQRAGRLWRHSTPTSDGWVHRRTRFGVGPVLDIIAALDDAYEDTLSPVARYPYLMAELKRTKAALEQMKSPIAIPGDVQRLVDAASITAEEVEYETNVSATDRHDEYFADLRRARKAGNVTIPFRGAGSRPGVLDRGVTFQQLSKLTTRHDLDEAATRFIDQDQETFLLIDPTGQSSYAWRGTVAEAAEATGETAREMLKSTLTMTLKKRERMPLLREAIVDGARWEPKSAAFKNVHVVELTKPYGYDSLLGLTGGAWAGD
ncbi:CRISPR-associated helicase Cas3' [Agromyces humi]|uniref:CRISPR-associated helicase Cas3' n=1 Tax=Agromyces humi TaxID=1766800 RepID=UPI00135C9619|nr:CRISPR-associated helicase Cas3' [Agromyces humi]